MGRRDWSNGQRRTGLAALGAWKRGAIALFVLPLLFILMAHLPSYATASSYTLGQAAPFNRPDYYPIVNPSSPDDLYRPVGDWIGRLILPDAAEFEGAAAPTDWVWVELSHTPPAAQDLLGQTVRLEWSATPLLPNYPDLVRHDIRFSEEASTVIAQGNVLPTRLNGRQQVGPLQSLAGARPHDDVEVLLDRVQRVESRNNVSILQTDWEPIQITGRLYGLVNILRLDESRSDAPPVDCPTQPNCTSEYFRVQHYNGASGQFDGAEAVVRIPQQPADRNGRFLSTPHDLQHSPAGTAGWYLYGAYNSAGMFTVQALKPRSLVQLQPTEVVLGKRAGRTYIGQQNWQHMAARKGTLQSVIVDPQQKTVEGAIAQWQEGDTALLIHLFGGIGGDNGESSPLFTVTGHYAYGLATVIREAITGELQFAIRYQQIYANNTNAVVSGTLDWTAYMGDLQRGWLGTRPVSDSLIKFDALARPFQFGNEALPVSILRELLIQTQVLTARYRTGDGMGFAAVTPATSCVQDSSQALFIAIERLKQSILGNEAMQTWLQEHPNDPESLRFRRVVAVGDALNAILVPRGIVRPDWKQNAEFLAGISGSGTLGYEASLKNAFLSWRSIMPRQAHDEVNQILLNAGAQLWFLRTNQVGGFDPTLSPIAPTTVLGQIPLLSNPLNRFLSALLTPLQFRGWMLLLAALGLYGAIALPYGLKTGFLHATLPALPRWLFPLMLLRLFFLPALGEEAVRVLIVPHPSEGVGVGSWVAWAALSLGLYVLYHPVNARMFYPAGAPTFYTAPFLCLCTLLGLACTLLYAMTGSLLGLVLLHWVVVSLWILCLNGYSKLQTSV